MTPCRLICCASFATFNTQELKIGWLSVVCFCKYILRFSEFSSGLLCELGGKDIVRAANCQLACSPELPCHRVSGYLKSCATVCLWQACLCFVLGGAVRGGRDGSFNWQWRVLMGWGVTWNTWKSSNVWVLSVKLCKDSSLNGCICLIRKIRLAGVIWWGNLLIILSSLPCRHKTFYLI